MSIALIGDVWMPEPVDATALGYSHVILNLEGPVCTGCQPAPAKINLLSSELWLPQAFPGVHLAACLANNHMLDYGAEGLSQTLLTLDRAGVAHFGLAGEGGSPQLPLILEPAGHSIALLGYVSRETSPVLGVSDKALLEEATEARMVEGVKHARASGADFVVVSVHWGAEEVGRPLPSTVRLARSVVDAGANLVVGHHPHCIQPFERYHDGWIFYSLGNAVMPNHDSPAYYNEQGVALGRGRKRQRSWNRASLAVVLDPATGHCRVELLHFSAGRLVRAGDASKRLDWSGRTTFLDERAFRRAFFAGKLRAALSSWLDKPKLPGVRCLRSLFGMANPREYR